MTLRAKDFNGATAWTEEDGTFFSKGGKWIFRDGYETDEAEVTHLSPAFFVPSRVYEGDTALGVAMCDADGQGMIDLKKARIWRKEGRMWVTGEAFSVHSIAVLRAVKKAVRGLLYFHAEKGTIFFSEKDGEDIPEGYLPTGIPLVGVRSFSWIGALSHQCTDWPLVGCAANDLPALCRAVLNGSWREVSLNVAEYGGVRRVDVAKPFSAGAGAYALLIEKDSIIDEYEEEGNE